MDTKSKTFIEPNKRIEDRADEGLSSFKASMLETFSAEGILTPRRIEDLSPVVLAYLNGNPDLREKVTRAIEGYKEAWEEEYADLALSCNRSRFVPHLPNPSFPNLRDYFVDQGITDPRLYALLETDAEILLESLWYAANHQK